MNPSTHSAAPGAAGICLALARRVDGIITLASAIPQSLIALLGRFSIAAVFWKSGQTKVEGLAIDLLDGQFHFGLPHLSDSATALFRVTTCTGLISRCALNKDWPLPKNSRMRRLRVLVRTVCRGITRPVYIITGQHAGTFILI